MENWSKKEYQFGTFEKLLDENASKKFEDERKRKNFHCLMMSRILNIGGSPEPPEAFSLCSDIFLKSLLVLLKIGIAAQSMNTYIILIQGKSSLLILLYIINYSRY